jgi:hypothetical protein
MRHHVGSAVRQQIKREGYTLLLVRPASFNPETAQRIIELFFSAYPRQAARFNPKAPRELTLILEPAEGLLDSGPTLGVVEHQSSSFLTIKPQDIDVVTFNLFRAVQNYPEGRYPEWLQAGLGDYARCTYGVNNAAANWSLGEYQPGQRYTDSYRVTARFFAWLERRIQAHLLEDLDQSMREGTYTEAFWTRHTGRNLDQLWAAYAADPKL